MTITYDQAEKLVKFEEVSVGSVFHEQSIGLCIKIKPLFSCDPSCSANCICLQDGQGRLCRDLALVTPYPKSYLTVVK